MMETDISTMAAGYVLLRLGVIAAFAYLIYRVVRPEPAKQPIRVHSNYANERSQVRRRG